MFQFGTPLDWRIEMGLFKKTLGKAVVGKILKKTGGPGAKTVLGRVTGGNTPATRLGGGMRTGGNTPATRATGLRTGGNAPATPATRKMQKLGDMKPTGRGRHRV